MPRTRRPRRADPRENRGKSNARKLAAAEASGDWREYYVIASQWVMAEAKHIGYIDPAKENDIYRALAAPLASAAKRLNEQTWSLHA
ncbi:hypothetical protein [Nonomuraea wenchangensis]|uniref:Uncharacterized protein n=1 Tax=Nonomuraea wenchangensis TaxID=568860 RepID=A0A1I0LWJ1_9ACTN|nr:hypothetical protein [Nonomuraea wenchangensis]SEU46695.1 hypothetical protein SAMN05421811_127122 [Nonomuraea wenchangensis]